MLTLLLQYGAHIDQRDLDGNTPLHSALSTSEFSKGELEAARYLLEKGATPDYKALSEVTSGAYYCQRC